MLVGGSHGLLYSDVLVSCFCAVVILIAVLRRRWLIIPSTVVSPKPMYSFLSGASALSPNVYRISSFPASLMPR